MSSAPATTSLATELLERVVALRRGLRRATSSPWPGSDLTGAQLELLRAVRRDPGLSVREAGDQLRVAPNTISTLVGRLVEAGHVERRRDDADRRVARLRLTSRAEAILQERRDERTTALHDALDALEPADREALHDALPALDALIARLGQQHG